MEIKASLEYQDFGCKPVTLRSEPDYYGASNVVASLIGKKNPPRSYASWQHGWTGISPLKYVHQLVTDGSFFNLNILVHTKQQQEFLRQKGYSNAHAVGMPYAYAWKFFESTPRKKSSLLVLPPHMTEKIDLEYNEDAYVNEIKAIENEFSEITVCITNACLKHGRWINSFKNAGYRIALGGSLRDANSLLRSMSLFSEHEYVTSPGLGSHLVYAGLSGCKVSLYGHVDVQPPGSYANHPYYQLHPEILEHHYSKETFHHRERLINKFLGHPADAITHQEWAMREAGIEMMRSPHELAKLLGWHPLVYYRLAKLLIKRLSQSRLGILNLLKLSAFRHIAQ